MEPEIIKQFGNSNRNWKMVRRKFRVRQAPVPGPEIDKFGQQRCARAAVPNQVSKVYRTWFTWSSTVVIQTVRECQVCKHRKREHFCSSFWKPQVKRKWSTSSTFTSQRENWKACPPKRNLWPPWIIIPTVDNNPNRGTHKPISTIWFWVLESQNVVINIKFAL